MKILSRTSIDQLAEWLEAIQTDGAAVLIDKATTWTSFDVVARTRSLTRTKKIGHAGTLDPLATGLLILCLGKATKKIQDFQDLGKEYVTTLKLGAVTSTYDSEGEETDIQDVQSITNEQINSAIDSFVGQIEQTAPMYSARKVGGKRLYQLARKGQVVERAAHVVTIDSIDQREIALPFVTMRVRCSKGTYIRSLAHDIGQQLGCGAYMSSLRRTGIGEYRVEDALTIAELNELLRPREQERESSETLNEDKN